MKAFAVACGVFGLLGSARAQPVVNGVANVASFALSGLPHAGIAQGSIFTVFGERMGPASLQLATSFPLPRELGGTSMRATVGGTSVSAIMVFTSANQAAAIESQVERFAPGFTRRIVARSVLTPADLERGNANLVGGDINGGVQDLRQVFCRPTWRRHGTPVPGLYLCSASTPPGGGVHGMCGYLAARRALRDWRR